MSKVEEERHLRCVFYTRSMSAAVVSAFAAIGGVPRDKHDLLTKIADDLTLAIFERGYSFGYDDGSEDQSAQADKGGASL